MFTLSWPYSSGDRSKRRSKSVGNCCSTRWARHCEPEQAIKFCQAAGFKKNRLVGTYSLVFRPTYQTRPCVSYDAACGTESIVGHRTSTPNELMSAKKGLSRSLKKVESKSKGILKCFSRDPSTLCHLPVSHLLTLVKSLRTPHYP